jgi:hypothetical protein
MTTSNVGETAVALATTKTAFSPSKKPIIISTEKSTMLEESPKPIQVNKGAGVRSKTISVIVNNNQKENNNQIINQKGENVKEKEQQEEETQSKTILSKMRNHIQKLKKPKSKG